MECLKYIRVKRRFVDSWTDIIECATPPENNSECGEEGVFSIDTYHLQQYYIPFIHKKRVEEKKKEKSALFVFSKRK